MKILLITVRSDFGGGPRHVHQIIENLPENYTIYVAAPVGEPYGTQWRHNKKIAGIFDLPYRKFSLKTLWQLLRYVKDNNIDIVHSHGNGAGMYSRVLKAFSPKLHVVHTFHGISGEYKSPIKKLAFRLMGVILKPLADRYIHVSHGEQSEGIKMGVSSEKNSLVIYNGIEDCGKLIDTSQKNEFIVVSLSRFDYQKNMDLSYRIASCFVGSNVKFIWVGNGPDYDRLKLMAEKEGINNIKFVGFSDTPFDFLLKSDVYLSTSRFEGLPYALIEAASVGLPIVASNVRGNNEVVEQGYNGILFSDLDDALKAIEKLKTDREFYLELSANAKKYFSEKFGLAEMIESLVSVYASL